MPAFDSQPLDNIKQRIAELAVALEECEIMVNGMDSAFWQILRRTYLSQLQVYKDSTRSAAETEDKSIRNFIGKEEGLEWAINEPSAFLDQAKRIKEELASLQSQLKELNQINEGVDSIMQDPMYRQPGTI